MSGVTLKIKKKKPVVIKSFRLIDFHIYDDSPPKENGSSSDEDEGRNNCSGWTKYKNTDDLQFVIQMFGINERGETCCIYVNDYQPFFYVKVGDSWTDYNAGALMRDLQNNPKLNKRYKNSIVSYELVDHYKLYGFSGGKKHKFIKFTFKNVTAMNKYKNLWYTYNNDESTNNGEYRTRTNIEFQGVTTELYESNIPPLLRYFHINNISPSGWVCFKVNKMIKPLINTTTCKHEFICPLKELISQPDKETIVPYKICSFDIEASSSHGDFPIPIKTYKRFASNVVDIFTKQMSVLNETMSKQLLQKMILAAFSFGKFEDIDIVYPKLSPTKTQLNKYIQILLNEPIESVKTENQSDITNYLLKMDNTFEQIRENQQYTGTGDDNGDETNEVTESNGYSNKNYIRKPKIKHNETILDVLMNEKNNRDEKIQILNEVMTRLFPHLEGDEVTFIGSTFLRYGEKEPYLNHCLAVGTCDDIPGIQVDCVDTEKDVLLKWAELIQTENPDIIIGYNIFGFDYEFMFRRAQENHCEREFLLLSRKKNELCATENRENPGELNIEHTKMQIASGEYDLRYFKTTGRLQIDMYAYFRRDFNLSSYKLDDVAGQYISDSVKYIRTIHDSVHGDVTHLCSKNLMGLNVDDFIHIELTGFTADYYNNGQKFKVLDIQNKVEVTHMVKGNEQTNTYNIIVISGHYDLDDTKSIKWGMAKDDVTPQDIFRLSKGTSAERAVVAKYCIQDCNLVHHLMNKIDVITGYVEMSRICSVPISFLVFRGQGIKLTSYVAKKCREKDTLMPDLEKTKVAEGYEGAIVLPPKCSMYMDNPVACVDYSSLYPSSMISQNYSHDSKVWSKEYNLQGELIATYGEVDSKGNFIYDNLPGYHYINIEFDTYEYIRKNPTSKAEKTKVGKMICRWAQFPDNKKGIMPSILEELLKARKDTRKMIKTEPDPFIQNILDKRQLGYKVTANSLYGQCGSRTSTFYEKDVAASTTATGRMMIIYAKRIIEEVYGDRIYETVRHGPVRTKAEYVYGDTDSVFFTFNLENAVTGEKIRGQQALEMTIEIAQDAADLCTKYLKPPMGLEYEKTLMPFILLSKKRYVGMLYEDDPNKGYMKFMGLSLKRRDSCDYLKDVYGGILNILMKEYNLQRAIQFLEKSLTDLIDGKVSMDKLAITKALRSGYKNPKQIGHFVLAERIGKRDPGNKPKPGDRMKFVFIVNDTPKALMGDKIETTEFIVENNLKIDYTHYITNQLMKPLQQLFGLALEEIWKIQGKTSAIKTYNREIKNMTREFPDIEIFMKKKEKFCSTKVKTLLFDDVLNKIHNQKYNIQTITSFFHR
jgi:DNA polymerase elongation subunit (family B)